jgi:hypothetical protein
VSVNDKLPDDANNANSQRSFETLIMSLNLSRFRAGSWASFLINLVTSPSRSGGCVMEDIVDHWMTSDELFYHSDLIILSLSGGTAAIIASEFPDRPFGRPLPNIETTCPCVVHVVGDGRKFWKVEHEARHGCSTKDVTLVVRCSLCERPWRLSCAHLSGKVCKRKERYCVKIGYQAQFGWE